MATTTKKKTTTKPKKPAPKVKVSAQAQTWANQAAMESIVRYQPQESVLEQAYNDAQQTYQQKVDAAKVFNQLQQATIAQQAPIVDQHYQAAGQQQDAANSVAQGQLAGLPADSPFRQALAVGVGTGISNRAGDQARAAGSFGQQAVQATQGAAFQASSAHDNLVSDLTKILAQKQDLAGQEGAFQSLTYSQLHDAASKLLHDTNIHKLDNASAQGIAAGHDATSITTAGISAAARNKASHGKYSATGVKLQTPEQHQKAGKQLVAARDILTAAQVNKHPHVSDAELVQQLEQGAPAVKGQPIYDPTTGKKSIYKDGPLKGQAKSTEDIPATPAIDPVLARAEVEMIRHGRISKHSQAALANAGYSIKQLGLVTPAQFAKRPKPKKKTPTQNAAKSVLSGLTHITGRL